MLPSDSAMGSSTISESERKEESKEDDRSFQVIEVKLDKLKGKLQQNIGMLFLSLSLQRSILCKKIQSIDSAIENVDELDRLEDNSHALSGNADVFHKKAKDLKRQKCREMLKSKLFMYSLIAVLLTAILLIILNVAGVM